VSIQAIQANDLTLCIPGLDHLALEAGSLEELQAWAMLLDTCRVARSEVRKVAGDLGAIFDFIDPDGIQIEFTHLHLG
jgi:glyoxylase I family protein